MMSFRTKCVNLHTHSNRSDGVLSPEELVKASIFNDVGVLCISDHNEFVPEELFLKLEERYRQQIKLVRGIECSTNYLGKEVHVLFLFKSIEKVKFLTERKIDRGAVYEEYRKAFRKCGIELPTYKEICRLYPESSYIAKKRIAEYLYKTGITQSVDEGFEEYISPFGKRRAFVDTAPYRKCYLSTEETIRQVREIAGDDLIAIIFCHPLYYQFNDNELQNLGKMFKKWAGPYAAIENIYYRYNAEERAYLTDLANKYGFMQSGASDYHGQSETDSLYVDASLEIWEKIEANYERQKKGKLK